MYVGHMTTTQQIADRIQSVRRTEGLSISGLSNAAGITEKTLRRKLADPERLTLADVAAISRALGTDIESLLVKRAPAVAA